MITPKAAAARAKYARFLSNVTGLPDVVIGPVAAIATGKVTYPDHRYPPIELKIQAYLPDDLAKWAAEK